MKPKMIIGFIILGVLSLIIGVCMYFDILNTKPLFVKWYAGVIIASGTILLGYITLSYDKNSSKKTDDILENTKSTGSNIIDLNKKADTSNTKIDILREENERFKLQITELDNKLSEKNKTILDLTQQTADLSIRLSEKAKSIYDINKAIKFSMPNSISVSYNVFFQLIDQYQNKADSIINKHYQFNNPGAFSGIGYELIKDVFDWNDYFSDWITVTFSKDYKISKNSASYTTPLLSFSNDESILKPNSNFQGIKKTLLYNPTERKFLIQIEATQLLKKVFPNLSLNPNLTSTSIFDLAKSTMILNQAFPDRFKSIEITHFKISSQELNLYFWTLNKSESDRDFIGDVKFYEAEK